jgi:hypothetical protein
VTNAFSEGGLDVNGDSVAGLDIFALHDEGFNKNWIKTWAGKIILNDGDIVMVREQFGEKVCDCLI